VWTATVESINGTTTLFAALETLHGIDNCSAMATSACPFATASTIRQRRATWFRPTARAMKFFNAFS
jgi:hypothetical protein